MNSDDTSNKNDSSDVIFYTVTKFFRSIETQTSKSEDKNRVQESIIQEIENQPIDSSSEDATAKRYRYCNEVIKPYLKNSRNFCSEFDDNLVRDELDSTKDDFPDYQPDFPYGSYNGGTNGFKHGHNIDEGTNTPSSESDLYRSIEKETWFYRNNRLKPNNSSPKHTYHTKGKEATCHKAGVTSPSKSDSSSQTDDFEFSEKLQSFSNMSPSKCSPPDPPPPPPPSNCETEQEIIIHVKCKNHDEGVKLRCTQSTETVNGKSEIKFRCKEERPPDTDLKCHKGCNDSLECKNKSSDAKLKCREEYPDGCGLNSEVKLKCKEHSDGCNVNKSELKYKCKEQPIRDSNCPRDDEVSFKCQEENTMPPMCPAEPKKETPCPNPPPSIIDFVTGKICSSLDSIFRPKDPDENSNSPCPKKSQDSCKAQASYKCMKIAEKDPIPKLTCQEKVIGSHKCNKVKKADETRLVCKQRAKVGPEEDITESKITTDSVIPKPKEKKPLVITAPCSDDNNFFENFKNTHYKTMSTLKCAADNIVNNFAQKSCDICKDPEAVNKVKKSCEDFINEVSKKTGCFKKEEPTALETAKEALYNQACETTQQINKAVEVLKCESKKLLGYDDDTTKPPRPKPRNTESVSKKSSIFSGLKFYKGTNNDDDDDDDQQDTAVVNFFSNVIQNVTSVVSIVGDSVNDFFRHETSSSFDRPTSPNLSNTTLTGTNSPTKPSQASKTISKVFSTIREKIYAIFSDATDVGQNVSQNRSEINIEKLLKNDYSEDDDDDDE